MGEDRVFLSREGERDNGRFIRLSGIRYADSHFTHKSPRDKHPRDRYDRESSCDVHGLGNSTGQDKLEKKAFT